MGIEPTCTAWKAVVLPLNYTRAPTFPLARRGKMGNGAKFYLERKNGLNEKGPKRALRALSIARI